MPIETDATTRRTPEQTLAHEYEVLGLRDAPRAALCLSGGGIRSAAFCLGVIQGLAQAGVLKRFDYLSTVSGGGYVGGYVSARIRECDHDVAAVEAELSRGADADWLMRLRRAGNFLTPELGLFSADTWTALTLYIRNLLLTWGSVLPWALVLVLAFIAFRTSLAVAGDYHEVAGALLALGAAGLAYSTYLLCIHMPSHAAEAAGWRDKDPTLRAANAWASRGIVTRTIWFAMAWPLLAPFGLGIGLGQRAGGPQSTLFDGYEAAALGSLYVVAVMAAYAIAAARAASGDARRLFGANWFPWTVAALASGVLTGLGAWLLCRQVPMVDRVQVLAVAGPFWLTIAMVVHAGTYMGLRRRASSDIAELDREWTARMSALVLRLGVAIAVVGIPVLVLADLVIPDANLPWSTDIWAGMLGPLVSGPAAAWLGRQAFARMTRSGSAGSPWTDRLTGTVLAVLAAVFAAAVLAALSAVMQSHVLGPVQQGLTRLLQGAGNGEWTLVDLCPRCPALPPALPQASAPPDVISFSFTPFVSNPAPPASKPLEVPGPLMVLLQLALAAVLAGLGYLLKIDNNRFTLHGLYRNRLVRGFLGAARMGRRPEPVTSFDPEDDMRLAATLRWTAQDDGWVPNGRKLFPVVNMAVNLTQSANPQWAERKALSFSATPLHCGYLLPSKYEGLPEATYVPTHDYNYSARPARPGETDAPHRHGFGLGTALTISGAAASPNAGYHSAPATAFLMTLFNVRLGLWAPNPAMGHTRRGLSSWAQLEALSGDLLGRTGIEGDAIYLSDGGHFDNLGLYEMLRRRCRWIVVVDAGQDAACAFEDLGNAVRKAAIDFGVTVAITAQSIAARKPDGSDADTRLLGFARGTITYPNGEGSGQLLYIKPTWLPDVPMDVRAYGIAEPQFPHQSTGDQWFSESQFESYRSLGRHQAERILGDSKGSGTIEHLFRAADTHLPPPATPGR